MFKYLTSPQLQPGVASANYDRDVVALGAAERQAAELFEPEGRVFGCRGASHIPFQIKMMPRRQGGGTGSVLIIR